MNEYCIAFWNVENLFDIEDSPRRSDKLKGTLRNELSGWTQDVLDKKLKQLASVIVQMNDGNGPDILGVCEVENDHVLKLLINELGNLNRNYAISHHDMSDNRGIDVAFIYDKDMFIAEKTFSHIIVKRSATRDLYQVNFKTLKGTYLILVGNHWPSRSAGQYESEPYRIIAGETLAYFHEQIRRIHSKNVAVIAMGDFNDEPFDRSLSNYAQSERSRTKVVRARSAKFLNLMWPIMGAGIGSHYYNNVPTVLDQFLVSKGIATGNSGIKFINGSVEIFRAPEMVKKGSYPSPIRFGRKSKINYQGFSDHFPIVMKVSEKG